KIPTVGVFFSAFFLFTSLTNATARKAKRAIIVPINLFILFLLQTKKALPFFGKCLKQNPHVIFRAGNISRRFYQHRYDLNESHLYFTNRNNSSAGIAND